MTAATLFAGPSALGAAATSGAVLWLLVTLLFQVRPFSQRFPTLDKLGLLPRWLFFSQGRAGRDCYILVRDRFATGDLGPWEPVTHSERSALTAVWHPAKHGDAILWYASDIVKERRRSGREAGIETSLCYLLVLGHCVYRHPRAEEALARQFALVETRGKARHELWVGFTSDFHPF